MWSLESRRDPVHQAALAFFLLGGMSLAGWALAHQGQLGLLAFSAVVSFIGLFVWRRSLAALVIGTAFFALFCAGAVVRLQAHHFSASYTIAFSFYAVLLFVIVRGLVSRLRRTP